MSISVPLLYQHSGGRVWYTSEFQASQGYTVRPSFKNQNNLRLNIIRIKQLMIVF